MSEFHVTVVKLGPIEKHPNADTLGITMVHGGYPCIVKLDDFKEGDLAVYIPIDALVDGDRAEFKWMGEGKKHRIKAKKLRGIFSMGLLIKARSSTDPDRCFCVGEDVQEAFQVEKYLPPSEREPAQPVQRGLTKRQRKLLQVWPIPAIFAAILGIALHSLQVFLYLCASIAIVLWACVKYVGRKQKRTALGPKVPYYDIEGFRKYKNLFQEGEPVVITEKIHGCNAKYTWHNGKFYCGSRTMFRDGTDHVWARAAEKYQLREKLAATENLVLFGEVYGPDCQDLHYGIKHGDVGFAAFDILDLNTGEYWSYGKFKSFCDDNKIPTTPELHFGEWYPELTRGAEGRSCLDKHVREGIVIRTPDRKKILKLVGEGYMLRK